MAEVQRATESGEMTQQFIEFVMMHAQQTALCLGQIPNPASGKYTKNLQYAKILIDQLDMIRSKTVGNLTSDESKLISGVLSELRMAFVAASQEEGISTEEELDVPADSTEPEQSEEAPSSQQPESSEPPKAGDDDSRKRFTKTYG